MRTIAYTQIAQTVEALCLECAFHLPPDVAEALRQAAARETHPRAREILEQLVENAQIAAAEKIPLCQDTGLAVVFIEQGADVRIVPPDDKPAATIADAVCQGVAAGYKKGFLRKSVVAEPLNRRLNTQTNTPPVIHYSVVPGQAVRISLMAKGGGCENKSGFRMFNPTESREAVIDWIVNTVRLAGASACPPFVVGVGLGGNFELSCLLAKKSLLRKIPSANPDPFYAQMEHDLLAAINATGLGPMGLGGDTTALAVCIETAPCHIASLPAAVNIECHSHRHKSITI